ncbi:MAG: hypothetical protein H7A36_05580 [Chlamydiales bacterium]|nr:hypothetical protein [Chlamydiales bacterium]
MRRVWMALALLCAGCANNYSDTGLYEKTGQMKPIVVVMPVINRVGNLHLLWDVSRELTDEIRKRVFDSSRLYLLREGGTLDIAKTLACPNPREISPAALRNFGASEFLVVTELIDQEQKPYGLHTQKNEETGAVLSVKMRVRVIDRRHPEPRVILQEVLECDHIVARAYLNTDYSKMPWGTEQFHNTPMGLAHSRVLRDLVSHIEGYIVAAR